MDVMLGEMGVAMEADFEGQGFQMLFDPVERQLPRLETLCPLSRIERWDCFENLEEGGTVDNNVAKLSASTKCPKGEVPVAFDAPSKGAAAVSLERIDPTVMAIKSAGQMAENVITIAGGGQGQQGIVDDSMCLSGSCAGGVKPSSTDLSGGRHHWGGRMSIGDFSEESHGGRGIVLSDSLRSHSLRGDLAPQQTRLTLPVKRQGQQGTNCHRPPKAATPLHIRPSSAAFTCPKPPTMIGAHTYKEKAHRWRNDCRNAYHRPSNSGESQTQQGAYSQRKRFTSQQLKTLYVFGSKVEWVTSGVETMDEAHQICMDTGIDLSQLKKWLSNHRPKESQMPAEINSGNQPPSCNLPGSLNSTLPNLAQTAWGFPASDAGRWTMQPWAAPGSIDPIPTAVRISQPPPFSQDNTPGMQLERGKGTGSGGLVLPDLHLSREQSAVPEGEGCSILEMARMENADNLRQLLARKLKDSEPAEVQKLVELLEEYQQKCKNVEGAQDKLSIPQKHLCKQQANESM